jgi:hypothetical protein
MADFSFWPGRFRNMIARTFVLSLTFPFLFCFLLSLSLSLLRALSLSHSLSGTQKYQCTSDYESPGDYFFDWGKTYNGAFLGIFDRALTFLTTKLPFAGVKKVSAQLKNL